MGSLPHFQNFDWVEGIFWRAARRQAKLPVLEIHRLSFIRCSENAFGGRIESATTVMNLVGLVENFTGKHKCMQRMYSLQILRFFTVTRSLPTRGRSKTDGEGKCNICFFLASLELRCILQFYTERSLKHHEWTARNWNSIEKKDSESKLRKSVHINFHHFPLPTINSFLHSSGRSGDYTIQKANPKGHKFSCVQGSLLNTKPKNFSHSFRETTGKLKSKSKLNSSF